MSGYEQKAARELREPGPPASDTAPSSHNTQCWRFQIAEKSISIAPDLERRCPVVDPDDHHVFVSLGCAAENMVHAALATELHADPRFDPSGDGMIAVNLEVTQQRITPLFQAISERQCTRGDYDGQAISPVELRQLEQAGTGDGLSVRLLTARPAMESVLEYVVAGNPALPRWLGSRLMSLFFTPKSENERYARQIRNSAGIAVFVSERSNKAHWVEAGRFYERFALQATALGIRNAFLNQLVEVAAIRRQFAAWLGLASYQRPDLVVRFGRGPVMPLSMRRPVQAVLV